jgi:hypothetical protein
MGYYSDDMDDPFEIESEDIEVDNPNRVSEPSGNKRFNRQRWACDVLEEMRTMLKSLNFSGLKASIEELQIMVNRMEEALRYKNNVAEWEEEAREIAAKVDRMHKEAYEMGLELDKQKHNALKLED